MKRSLVEAAIEHTIAISTFPVPKLSKEQNLFYEKLYINSQKQHKKQCKREEFLTETGQRMPNPNRIKKPKKKVALLMSYCGTGYQGMQINPDVPSIELDLHKALAASEAVSEDNAMDANKMSFVRCARTDKGVHAGGQIVSLKMSIDQEIIPKINSFLPDGIKVWGYARVNNNFHAKNKCDGRIYEYLLPTYVLQPVDPLLYPHSSIGLEANATLRSPNFEKRELPAPTKEKLDNLRLYRIKSDTLQSLKDLLELYVGSNTNYHNFTVGKSYKDRSSYRNIQSFVVGDPFVRSGIEFLSLKVTGQSFMLHQIRKMVGLVVMMIRTKTPNDLLPKLFQEQRVNIPKAPALGLLLERPLFTLYNQQVREKISEKDEIDFGKFEKEITEFKEKFIYSKIVESELREGTFEEWTRIVDECSDDYGWWLRADGEVKIDAMPPYLFKSNMDRESFLAGEED